MGYDYTAWATISNLAGQLERVQNLDYSDRVDDYYLQAVLDAVAQEIAKRTRRQFVITRDEDGAAVEETRYFDGSGTGEQVVDEYVTISDVSLVGYSGVTPASLTNWYAESDSLYPRTVIAINQGGPPAYGYGYYTRFPQGRRNVAVTATWGYGATIPADMWMSHLEESAARIVSALMFDADGREKRYTVADALTVEVALALPGEAANWHPRFLERCRDYESPKVHAMPGRKPVMI